MGTQVEAAALSTVASQLVARIERGEAVPMSDVLDALRPSMPVSSDSIPVAPPAVMTDAEKEALARLPEVFGVVCPREPRRLSETEVDALVEERAVLATLEGMMGTRKTDIRTIVFAHLDTEIAEHLDGVMEPPKDGRGNYLVKGEVVSRKHGARLTREIRKGSVTVSVAKLKELADDPEVDWFTHEDYLAMTAPVRVVDELNVALFMRKNPEVAVKALAAASERGADQASCYTRSAHVR